MSRSNGATHRSSSRLDGSVGMTSGTDTSAVTMSETTDMWVEDSARLDAGVVSVVRGAVVRPLRAPFAPGDALLKACRMCAASAGRR